MLFYLLGILKPIGSRAGGISCTSNPFNILKIVCISSSFLTRFFFMASIFFLSVNPNDLDINLDGYSRI